MCTNKLKTPLFSLLTTIRNARTEIVEVPRSGCSRGRPVPGWLRSMRTKRSEATGDNQYQPKIPRVLSTFRKIEKNNEHFEPSVVSIGPYHHGKEEFKEMEELKFAMACEFIQYVEKKGTLEQMYDEVQQIANEARKSYTKDATEHMNDEQFIKMMFIDGCFTLQFIFYFVSRYSKILELTNSHVAGFLVKRDLFLLENQLPFQVLKSLMSYRFEEEKGKKLINDFIMKMRGVQPQQDSLAKRFVSRFWLRKETVQGQNGDQEVAHLLDLFHSRFTGQNLKGADYPKDAVDHNWCSYRSAMELKTVGIHFLPSNTDLLTDLHYESTCRGGTLRLPRIVVDNLTKTLLLNLLAYEAWPGSGKQDLLITSYVCFLDSLIDHPEDVKELRKRGILLNILGSDQEVADLFNEIASFLVSNPSAYKDVKQGIEKHYKSLIKKWIAEWLHTHFSSPWTLSALVGALVALFLEFVQTYAAIFLRS